jgi:anaerobic selenocysteine-containing dehydrogenase
MVLPTCARDEEAQATTQESGFSYVRLSEGGMKRPAGAELKTEVEIVTSLGARLLPEGGPVDFRRLRDHNAIREVMAKIVPGYAPVGDIGLTKQEFHVEGRVRHEPVFPTPDGKAHFLPVSTPPDELAPGELRLMTVRSEGQFNTVVYEEEDVNRGIESRDVILMNGDDLRARSLKDGDRVTVRSEIGEMTGLRAVEYRIARGCAAMYYPESNVLVRRRIDGRSGTPSFKNVPVRVERAGQHVEAKLEPSALHRVQAVGSPHPAEGVQGAGEGGRGQQVAPVEARTDRPHAGPRRQGGVEGAA